MTRTQAYRAMLMGSIVKHEGKIGGDQSLPHYFGSTTPPKLCYYKCQVPDKIVWSDDPTADAWLECSIYDPIFWGDFDFIWSIYERD